MKIQFVGAGSAFNKEDGQTNILIQAASGKHLLIDCGTYCWHSMKELGLGVCDVAAAYVSHLHADHTGGFEELAFCTFFNPAAKKPTLYGNFHVIHDLWEQTLRGGLESIQAQQMTLDSYFDVQRIQDNGQFIWEGIAFKPVQTVHVVNDCTIKFSYGLLVQEGMTFSDNGKDTVCLGKPKPVVFFTTDTQFCPQSINDFYKRADVIFHDCETTPYQSGVHAHYENLKTLPDDIREKMYLCHYQQNPPQRRLVDVEAHKDYGGDLETRVPVWENDGFAGMVEAGQEFEI